MGADGDKGAARPAELPAHTYGNGWLLTPPLRPYARVYVRTHVRADPCIGRQCRLCTSRDLEIARAWAWV